MMVRFVRCILTAAVLVAAGAHTLSAQDFDQTSCDEFLLPQREARSQRVGLAVWPICSRMSSALPSRRRRSTSRLRSAGLM